MMRTMLVILVLAFSLPAAGSLAQDSEQEFVWVATSASATRFLEPGSSKVEDTVEGEKLQVVYREGDRIRLRFKGSKFGWVDAATVSDSAPVDTAPAP
jgi:hypothetical protein